MHIQTKNKLTAKRQHATRGGIPKSTIQPLYIPRRLRRADFFSNADNIHDPYLWLLEFGVPQADKRTVHASGHAHVFERELSHVSAADEFRLRNCEANLAVLE